MHSADSTVTGVNPNHLANDLDMPITITGTDFTTPTAIHVGDRPLDDWGWVNSATLTATVPWGLTPGIYTLTVVNSGGITTSLNSALTITQGIGVWQAGELYGGELKTLAINTITPTTLFGSSEDVGLFRTRDGGEHWSFVYAPGANAVALDPVSPTTLYWGSQGSMWRSDDEGETWTRLTSAPGMKPYPHPTTSGTLFAGKLHEEAGLWLSTDSGQTWAPVTTGLTDTHVTDLVFHPTDPMTVVVGTSSGNLFVSTDGGQAWTFAAKPVANVQTLAFSPAGELWISDCCFCVPQKSYRSTNASFTSFTEVLAAPLKAMAFPPAGWGAAYSQTTYAAGCWSDAYVTEDGGTSWSDWGPAEGGWGWSIALDPQAVGTAYKASHQHSVYKTTDAGVSWQIKNRGVTAMAPTHLGTVPGSPQIIYSTVKGWSGLFRSTQGGAAWQFLPITHTDNSNINFLVDPHVSERLYADGNAAVYRSDDAGASWTVTGTLAAPAACTVNVQAVSADVVKSNPAQSGMLLAGTHVLCNDFSLDLGEIYSSTDAGVTWAAVSISHPISPVLDIIYDPVTPTIVYASTQDTGLLRSLDGGQSWQATGAAIPALANVNSLTADHQPPHQVYALTSGQTRSGLYATTDHGDSWTQMSPSWVWGNQILSAQEAPPALYVASYLGLLKSSDGGVSWRRAEGDLARVPIYALANITTTDRSILYAGTTGGLVTASLVRTVASDDAGTLVRAGVHRYTALRSYQIYLPLVIRAGTTRQMGLSR